MRNLSRNFATHLPIGATENVKMLSYKLLMQNSNTTEKQCPKGSAPSTEVIPDLNF
jgi:ribonuclease HIII